MLANRCGKTKSPKKPEKKSAMPVSTLAKEKSTARQENIFAETTGAKMTDEDSQVCRTNKSQWHGLKRARHPELFRLVIEKAV